MRQERVRSEGRRTESSAVVRRGVREYGFQPKVDQDVLGNHGAGNPSAIAPPVIGARR